MRRSIVGKATHVEMKDTMPLMFFARDIEENEPEVHSLDIYIGEHKPVVHEGATVREFKGLKHLRSFLMKGEWDRATIYKSSECPQEVVDDLAEWMNLHMSLSKVITLNGDKSGRG